MFRGTRIDCSIVTCATELTIEAFSSTVVIRRVGLFHSRHRAGVASQDRGVVLPSCPHYRFFLRLMLPDNLHCRISLRIMGV